MTFQCGAVSITFFQWCSSVQCNIRLDAQWYPSVHWVNQWHSSRISVYTGPGSVHWLGVRVHIRKSNNTWQDGLNKVGFCTIVYKWQIFLKVHMVGVGVMGVCWGGYDNALLLDIYSKSSRPPRSLQCMAWSVFCLKWLMHEMSSMGGQQHTFFDCWRVVLETIEFFLVGK